MSDPLVNSDNEATFRRVDEIAKKSIQQWREKNRQLQTDEQCRQHQCQFPTADYLFQQRIITQDEFRCYKRMLLISMSEKLEQIANILDPY